MAKQKLLFVTHRIFPYLPVEEPTLGKQILQKIAANGYEIRTFMPKFGAVNERRNQLHEVIRLSGINIVIDNNDHPLIIKVASLQPARIQVYFIDNDDYFIKSPDDEDVLGSNRKDNDERSIFFAHGTADTVRKLKWEPAIIHISGWISALLPLYLKHLYADEATYLKSKIIYSVLPGEITGGIDTKIFDKLEEEGFSKEILNKYRSLPADTNMMHTIAIDNSDAVIFHSPDVDPKLLKLAEDNGVPILKNEDLDEEGKRISEFYKQLIDEE